MTRIYPGQHPPVSLDRAWNLSGHQHHCGDQQQYRPDPEDEGAVLAPLSGTPAVRWLGRVARKYAPPEKATRRTPSRDDFEDAGHSAHAAEE